MRLSTVQALDPATLLAVRWITIPSDTARAQADLWRALFPGLTIITTAARSVAEPRSTNK